MAFTDKEVVLYDGTVKITYHDKAHMYYRRFNEGGPDNPVWGKAKRVKGVTTMIDGTLEKKGLMTWPMGLALGELFGFYNFTNENGEKMLGFSKGKGTLWVNAVGVNVLRDMSQEDALPHIKSASEAWFRQKKKGADIGSVVHEALEHYVKGEPFSIAKSYNAMIEDADYEDLVDQELARREAPEDIRMAETAFAQFKEWWDKGHAKLISAEELLFSREMDYCGTYDALLEIDGKQIRADWKTSKASASREAAAPQGVYYSYFVQLGFYEAAAQEMGQKPSDDLLCVSVRKDGGFDLVYASALGLTVQDCIDWAKAVHTCYVLMTQSKANLLKGGKDDN